MFGEFSWEEKFDSGLDLPGRKSSLSVVSHQFARLVGKSVKSIINKGIHDVHCFLADSDFRVDLLQDLVDVEGESLDSSLGSLLGWSISSSSDGFGGFSGGHVIFKLKLLISF